MIAELRLINELVKSSESCLPGSSIRVLARISKRIVKKRPVGDEDLYVILPDNQVLILPVSQLPEVWLNILHVYCFEDYTLNREFLPRPGWVIIDLGAYIGIYTLYALGLMGRKGKVIAVEPNPLAVKYLKMNVEINGLDGEVIIEPTAITSKPGYRDLYVCEYWGVSTLIKEYLEKHDYKFRKYRVKALSIDELVMKHYLKLVNLMKVDVEGSEWEVVNNLWRVLRHSVVERVVIEVHRDIVNIHNLVITLRSLGYDVVIKDLGLKNQLFLYAINT